MSGEIKATDIPTKNMSHNFYDTHYESQIQVSPSAMLHTVSTAPAIDEVRVIVIFNPSTYLSSLLTLYAYSNDSLGTCYSIAW